MISTRLLTAALALGALAVFATHLSQASLVPEPVEALPASAVPAAARGHARSGTRRASHGVRLLHAAAMLPRAVHHVSPSRTEALLWSMSAADRNHLEGQESLYGLRVGRHGLSSGLLHRRAEDLLHHRLSWRATSSNTSGGAATVSAWRSSTRAICSSRPGAAKATATRPLQPTRETDQHRPGGKPFLAGPPPFTDNPFTGNR